MKKIIVTILVSILAVVNLCASSRFSDRVIASKETKEGLIFTLYEERDGDLYITVESNNEKDKIKAEADTIEEAKIMFDELERELLTYSKNHIKSFIKDNKKMGEWERDDDTRIKYFEVDDDFFDFTSLYNNEEYSDFFD